MSNSEFFVLEYPAVRTFTADTGRISRDKHYVHSLLEVDVSDALQKVKSLRSSGKKVSFLAWFIKVLADTVANHPPINGIKKGRNKIVVFRSINVSTVVEKRVDDKAVPLPLVLREANTKTHFQLYDEIQNAVDQVVLREGNLILGEGENNLLMKMALIIPRWLRLFIMKAFIFGNPRRMQQMMGTVMVSSLGTSGGISAWIVPASMHPLSIGIGSLTKKAMIHKGQVKNRNILHLTVAFDHDVIDGMPARCFVEELVAKLESGAGLDQES